LKSRTKSDRAPDSESVESREVRDTGRKFLDRETTGGLLLIAATVIALALGNSPWADAYHHLLRDEIVLGVFDHFTFRMTVEGWINDGLMSIFFLVAGMELKREVLVGELSSLKKASMPLLGALGGMVVPALVFVGFNLGTRNIDGWAIPMATDIAYSLGIIGLLGKRVPAQLKVFLIALAIADDLGAILIIAIFYSEQIRWTYMGAGVGVFVALLACNHLGLRGLVWYVFGGVLLWYCFLSSGVHPSISGVLFAVAIPVKPGLDSEVFVRRAAKNVEGLKGANVESRSPFEDEVQRDLLDRMAKDSVRASSPLLRMENALVGVNALFIVPVFAVANAGVELDVSVGSVLFGPLGMGIVVGLVVGKSVGVISFVYAGKLLGFGELHESLRWGHVVGGGMIAGIGFTMSLFITALAFGDPGLVKVSKIAVLVASLISALGGAAALLSVHARGGSGRAPA
jgi:NhaA family Na+:H+ antiporter